MTATPPLSTVNDLFLHVAGSGHRRAVLWQDEFGNWQGLSSDQIYQRVRKLGQTFLQWGAKKGDRIALISENRWEWAVTDFAILGIGAVNVPVYPTLTGEQIAELIRDSGCRIAVVSTRQQYEKLHAVRRRAALQQIVLMDPGVALEGAISMGQLLAGADAGGAERDATFDALIRSAQPDDLATLIYTSGTTGEPKGVMLTHGNIASNQNLVGLDFSFARTDACISFLPLSHITARALDYVMYLSGAQVIYCSQFDKLPQVMKQVRPTVFVGVPRVYEKIRQAVEQKAAASAAKRGLLGWSLKVGARHQDAVYAGKEPSALAWKLANKLIYSKVREAFGGRVRIFISGGAPLGIDTARWFAWAGIAVWEGYGLTETSPVISLNTPLRQRMGSVGKPLANLELKFGEDQELLVRGPSIFSGYWNKSQASADCLDAQRWFRTGDIGHLDGDGFLYITDRKKELLKTSGGKLIAPQPIENKLKNSHLVAQAALVGDKHKFISALIAPNFTALEAWATAQGIEFRLRPELVTDQRVISLYGEIVRGVNSGLANFETIKRFRVVSDEWSQDSGELTPSMKLKRRVIAQKYATAIAELYADEATAHAESA